MSVCGGRVRDSTLSAAAGRFVMMGGEESYPIIPAIGETPNSQ